MNLLLALSVLAAAGAPAQDGSEKDPSPQAESGITPMADPEGWTPSVSLLGRASLPGEGKVSSHGEVLYSDLLRVGSGLAIEGDLMQRSAYPEWGAYLSLGWDHFAGRSKDDGLNDAIHAKGQNVTGIFLGPKVRGRFWDEFFWEGRLGVGWAHQSSMQATVVINGSPSPDQELLRSSDRLAGELGARVGWRARQLAIELGVSARFMNGPAAGRDSGLLESANAPIDIRPGLFYPVVIELGIRVDF
jgi:hypothetical protein